MPERFFDSAASTGPQITLKGDEARHLARVRRVPIGALVEVFDGEGAIWGARVEQLGKDEVILERLESIPDERRARCRLTVATAFPKGERIDWLVEKATELGVDRLVPLVTSRSVVDPRAGKLDRLRRAVVEACKQCGRGKLMEIAEPIAWNTYATRKDLAGPIRLLCHPRGAEPMDWPEVLPGSTIEVAIGPEGGFTEDEARLAESAGWQPISLGATLLRIETAAIAVACALFHECGRQRRA